jgi:hypothetical protein
MFSTITTSCGTKDQSGEMLKDCTELKNGIFHKDNERKRSSNIESVLSESQVSYEEEIEKNETVLPNRNTDELQAVHDKDCTPKKHKKKKRHTKEFYCTEENENACVSQCEEELETMEEGSSCTGNEMPSKRRKKTEAKEVYETLVAEADDIDTELPFRLREVGIPFSHILY